MLFAKSVPTFRLWLEGGALQLFILFTLFYFPKSPLFAQSSKPANSGNFTGHWRIAFQVFPIAQ